MSAWSAFPASAPSSSWLRSCSRRISRRSFRSIRAAPMARRAVFATNIPAASFISFVFCCRSMRRPSAERASRSALPPEREKLWQEAMANPDFKMYPHVYNVLALKGQHFPAYFDMLIDPYDKEEAVRKSEAEFAKSISRPIPAPAGTATRTRPISMARRTGFATSSRAEEAPAHRARPSRSPGQGVP